MSPRPSMKPAIVYNRVAKMVAGINKHVLPGMSFTVAGVVHTRATLLAQFQPVLQIADDLKSARTTVRTIIQRREQLHAGVRPLLENLTYVFGATFGAREPTMEDFGIPRQKRRRQLTAEEKLIATTEGVRTRRARGSYTSKKARQDVTVAGKPGLALVGPDGKVTVIQPPAPPGKPRPKRK